VFVSGYSVSCNAEPITTDYRNLRSQNSTVDYYKSVSATKLVNGSCNAESMLEGTT
jgi:hypothetical protein